jgi:hypothetical protein
MQEKERIALHITKDAKDNTFVDSKIIGGVKIAGTGNKMIRTEIFQFRRDHPKQFWTIIGVLLTAIGIVVAVLK